MLFIKPMSMGAASFLHVFALLVTLEMTIHKCLQAHLNFIVDTPPHPCKMRELEVRERGELQVRSESCRRKF